MKQQRLSLITSSQWQDYELLDSGNLLKFERFGPHRFIRPEPQAMWQPRTDLKDWQADGIFVPGKLGNKLGCILSILFGHVFTKLSERILIKPAKQTNLHCELERVIDNSVSNSLRLL